MTIYIISKSERQAVRLEEHVVPARQAIWVGAHSEAVYNTVIVDTNETFLCTITPDGEAGTWQLTAGQVRTECPRGLRSERQRACSKCRGCCAYIRTANPDYSLRLPQCQVRLNGQPLPPEGALLQEGDEVSF